jgi:hypothetical protein
MRLIERRGRGANGVRPLAAWCLGRGCDHFRIVDVSGETKALARNRRQHFQYLQGRGRQLRRPFCSGI